MTDFSPTSTSANPLISTDRLAILLHDGTTTPRGKTGLSLLRYSELPIVAVIDQACAGQSLPQLTGIPREVPIVASVQAALALQPTVLAIGIAPSGGGLPAAWQAEVQEAIEAGVSVMNGLHTPMTQPGQILKPGQWVWEVRREPSGLQVGSGKARLLGGRRVLTVGTDMSVGKMSASLELDRTTRSRGLRSQFVATGQTGLMLGHDGVALDAVRIDFAAGAVEQCVLRSADCDVVYVEGQGSLMNPASTATLPLLRGTQPTHLVLVHRAGQTHIANFPHVPIPPLPRVIQVYETVAAAGGSFAPAKIVGIALNTGHLSEPEAQAAIAQTQDLTQLPCTDVIRYSAEPIVEAILAAPIPPAIDA